MKSIRPHLIACAITAALVACTPAEQAPPAAEISDSSVASTPKTYEREAGELEVDPLLADAGIDHHTVAEAYITAETPADNIDSPAVWVAADGAPWLIATAKEGDKGLVVYHGDTGETLRSVGTLGAELGQFDRPNGVFVHGDRVLVVERDNHRVQVLALPDFTPVGSFGEAELQKPYGLWVRGLDDGRIEVLVTDAYTEGEDAQGDDILPSLENLDRRLHRFEIRFAEDGLSATHAGVFGDTSEAGAIRVPESIWGDETHGRLMVAEEHVPAGTAMREYGIDGKFRGQSIGVGLFRAQAEGIALWKCDDGSGYWLATDQFKDRSLFHVFDRESLQHLGAFAGNSAANTDGVWLHQPATARFTAGVFYAVHDDKAVAAFDWRDIAKTLKLRESCE